MLIYNYKVRPTRMPRHPILVDNVSIKIQLLDTPFVKRWVEYLNALSERVPVINWYMTSQASNERNMKIEEIHPLLYKVYKSFVFFHKYKIQDFTDIINEIDFLLNNPEQLTQHHLNKYHRWFTTLSTYFFINHRDDIPEGCDKEELFFNIHDVNTYVHSLEQYTYYDLSRRRLFPICKQWSTQAHNAHNLNNLQNHIWDDMEFLESGIFDFFNEGYDHTFWLHEDIQGKEQLKAWMDHDDLKPDDITGNLFMTPNVTFDPYKIYKTIMDRDDFRQESKESGKTVDKPPLGDIVNIDEIPWEFMVDYDVTSIVLDDKVLWKL